MDGGNIKRVKPNVIGDVEWCVRRPLYYAKCIVKMFGSVKNRSNRRSSMIERLTEKYPRDPW
jgi:hypothetical protein